MRLPTIESSLLAQILLAVAAPVFGTTAYLAASEYEDDRAIARFGELLGQGTARIEREFTGLIEGLHSVGSLFQSSEEVTREEFETFTRSFLDRYPGVLAVEWAPLVLADEREGHESAVRSDDLPTYGITALGSDGGRVTAPRAEEHYPILYVEPRPGNETVPGLDLTSERARHDALRRAVETGAPTLSEPVDLIQSRGDPAGALILLPVENGSHASRSPDRDAPPGVVLLVARHRDVVEQALRGDRGSVLERMRLEVLDATADGTPVVLFAGGAPLEEVADAPWTASSEISIGGRRWAARATPSELFLEEHHSTQPILFAITVFLVTGLLYGTLVLLWRRSHQGTRRRQDRFVSRVLRNLQEGVIVGDRHGRIRFANEPVQRIMGPDIPESPTEWAKACGCYMSDGHTPYPKDELPLLRAVRGEIVDPEDVFVRNEHNPGGIWLSISGTPLLDESGKPRGGVVVIRDTSEVREKQAHVERLSNALDQTADMVVITDHVGRIIYVNPAFSEQTGYSAEEALGDTPRILRSGVHDTTFYQELWSTVLSGRVFRAMITNRRKNGAEYRVDQVITPVTGANGEVTHFVTVGRDMTDRLRWEEQAMEMRMASMVQERLYPQTQPQLLGLEVAGTSRPAVETCGDYYDFILGPDGRLFLAIGDICGHGLGPALLMAETRAYLRGLIRTGGKIGRIMEQLNALLEPDLADNYFVTLLLVEIDPDGDSFSYVNAGHTTGYLVDGDGRVKGELDPTGPALGIIPDSEYECPPPAELEPEDTLLLLTDGIVEARAPDRSFFEAERALGILCRHRDESAERIVDRLGRAVEEFVGDELREDDQTVVVCKRIPKPMPRVVPAQEGETTIELVN